MKKLQSLDSKLFKTLEASAMKAVNGGIYADPSKTATEAGITVYSNGDPATVDSPSNPNDGCDDNC